MVAAVGAGAGASFAPSMPVGWGSIGGGGGGGGTGAVGVVDWGTACCCC